MTYLRLIGAFIVACLVAGLLWYRSEATAALAERDRARADLAVAVDANNAAQATIGRLRADAEHNDQIIAQMAADLDTIQQQTTETNDAIGALKEQSADVKAYLAAAVPPELRKLLDH